MHPAANQTGDEVARRLDELDMRLRTAMPEVGGLHRCDGAPPALARLTSTTDTLPLTAIEAPPKVTAAREPDRPLATMHRDQCAGALREPSSLKPA
jgi:hypothetical protein